MGEEAFLKCMFCGASTHVARTTKTLSGRRIVRHRQCNLNATHRFETEEAVPAPALTSVGIRRSGSGVLSGQAFDRERLFGDLAAAILVRAGGEDDRIERVVTRTVSLLERNLTKILEPLTAAEMLAFPHLKGSIPDTVIADVVEEEMQRSAMRMSRLLYALSIRGRQDREGRKGWSNASEVLAWIGSVYPRLHSELPQTAKTDIETTWNIHRTPSLPKFVVKRDGRSGNPPFVYEQFVESIERAMLGRKKPKERSTVVAARVLTSLEGQEVVHASQLGVGVMDSLRQFDDIAYLRWATILKKIPSVTAFTNEARGLVLHPSPRPSIKYLEESDLHP